MPECTCRGINPICSRCDGTGYYEVCPNCRGAFTGTATWSHDCRGVTKEPAAPTPMPAFDPSDYSRNKGTLMRWKAKDRGRIKDVGIDVAPLRNFAGENGTKADFPVAAIRHTVGLDPMDAERRNAIVALGPAAVPELLAVIDESDEMSSTWATSPALRNAWNLLGHVADSRALSRVIAILERATGDEPMLFAHIEPAVRRLGDIAWPGLMRQSEEALHRADYEKAQQLADMLAESGCCDPRLVAVYRRLVADGDPLYAALRLAEIHGQAAVPDVERALACVEQLTPGQREFDRPAILELVAQLKKWKGMIPVAAREFAEAFERRQAESINEIERLRKRYPVNWKGPVMREISRSLSHGRPAVELSPGGSGHLDRRLRWTFRLSKEALDRLKRSRLKP